MISCVVHAYKNQIISLLTFKYILNFFLPFSGRDILDSTSCTISWDKALVHSFEISTFLFFFAPMTAITVLYGLIGWAIRRSTLSRTGSDSSTHSATTGSELRAQQQARARRVVLKMLGEYPVFNTNLYFCYKSSFSSYKNYIPVKKLNCNFWVLGI